MLGTTDTKRTIKEAEDLAASITDGEKMLLDLFRQVPEERQQLALDLIRFALTRDL